ncbi:MAG: amino acid adenylation domain-containing protein, partial [Acidobacteriota bacterium]
MTLLELLDDCARKGIILTADGDKLHVRSSNGDVTPEMQSELRRHKPELLVRLGRPGSNLITPARSAHASEWQPLSLAQQSLWFLHQMDPATLPAYNIRKAFVVNGPLDAERWADAFRVVVSRHAALRSSFERVDEHPVARISSAPPSMEIVDLTGCGDEEVSRRIDREGRHTFDLSQPSLIRASLLRLSPDRSIFIVNAQHLVADAWSAGVVLHEISEIYEGRALAPPALSYHDYVDWQRQRIARGELEPHLAYWKAKLADLRPLELPADHPRSATTGYEGASESYVLPGELTAAIRAFIARRGTTLFSTMLASFAAALYRFTGQDDFPIGTSVAGRTRKEFENVVGLFADLLVLRMDVSASPSFSDLVTRVQETAAEGFEHQDAPFDWIVKSLRPGRPAGQNPLFQVLFLLLQSDPHFAEVQVPGVAAKFDLSLHVEDTGSEIRGLIEFKTALFERSTIRGFLSCWLELLEAALADPSQPVTRLPIVTAQQRHDLLSVRNQIRRVPLPHATIAEAFEAQAARTPDRIAVKSGDRVLTYRDLDERANRVARALRDRGVGPEVRIGLHLQRSADVVVAILGVLKAGGAYVPFDPSDPEARRQFMRDDSGIAMVIDDVDELCRETKEPSSRRFTLGSPAAGALPPAAGKVGAAALHPSNAAYVIYTSGSTGQPRGVVVTHENVLRLMASTEPWFQFNQDDVWTLFHSYAFDFSVWEVWGALLYGGRVVIVPQITSRSPEMFHQLLRDEHVTVLNQTPSAFRALIEVPGEIRSLRYVIFGGEKLDLSMLRPWFDRYGDRGPRMINMYGITETTVHVTWRSIEQADVEANRGSVIGARIPDLTLHILDDELEPVPDGVTGHLHVGGAGLSRGYLNRPSLTAERFIPDPFSQTPGARLYRTGDLARRRHDDIEYLGRSDAQVKIRGFRIEPGEIEATLRAHPGIRECVVVAHDGRLIAYFI